MSFVNPVNVPVTVYKWDDDDAPALDGSAQSLLTVIKACLVTGYGSKQAAGWTMPFEDTSQGVKVFRAEVGVESDFYLRLSDDNGKKCSVKGYTEMSDIDSGSNAMTMDSGFRYAMSNRTGKWLLIANSRSFWLFTEEGYDGDKNKRAAWLFAGDTTKNSDGQKLLYIQHSGGTWSSGAHYSLVYYTYRYKDYNGYNPSGNIFAQVYGAHLSQKVQKLRPYAAMFDGTKQFTEHLFLTPVYLIAERKLYTLPGIFVPSTGDTKNNFDVTMASTSGDMSPYITMGTSGSGDNVMLMIKSDEWSY